MLKRALRAARKRCAVLLEATHSRSTKHTGGGVAPALCPPKPRDARPAPRTNPQPDQATSEPTYRATSQALRVAEIVDLIASFLAPPDQLAFTRTHSFAFHAIAPRIWRRLPSLRPLVNLLPSDLDGLEDNLPKRWAFYTRQVNELSFDETDARNQFPIPWTILHHMSDRKTLLPTLETVIWKCNTARCATALLYFVNEDTLRHLDLGFSDYFSVDIPEARAVLTSLADLDLRLSVCKLRMLEDSPFEHPVGDGLMWAIGRFLSSVKSVRTLSLSPSLLSQDVFEVLAQLDNVTSFSVIGREPNRPWPAIPSTEDETEVSRLPFQSLASMETLHVGIATCNAMLRRGRLQALTNIRVWTAYLPPVDAVMDFISAAGQISQLQALSLSISAAIPLEDDRREYALVAAALHPLYECSRLRSLELSLACPTMLTPTDVELMIQAWPLLRVLRLSGAGCEGINFRSRLNFATLLQLAESLPDLRVLQIDINADLSGVDLERVNHCSQDDMDRRCRLETLDVGWAWWPPNGPSREDITDALLDIFPHGNMDLKWDTQLPKHVTMRWRDVREAVIMYR